MAFKCTNRNGRTYHLLLRETKKRKTPYVFAHYEYLGEVTDRVISQAIHAGSSEAAEREQLGPPAG